MLGFGVYDAAKVMGLAAYGDPDRFRHQFDQLAWTTSDGAFDMDHDRLRFAEIMYYPPSADHRALTELFDVVPRAAGDPLRKEHEDIAAALQEKTDELVVKLALHLCSVQRSSPLCQSGAVASSQPAQPSPMNNQPSAQATEAGANSQALVVRAGRHRPTPHRPRAPR